MRKNSKYYNNGVVNRMIVEGEKIPDGFTPGMLKRTKEQIEESNKKRKKTCLEKYGGVAPLCSNSIKEKSKNTNLHRYGVENPMQSREVQEKAKQTNLERYGVESTFQGQFREKQKQTNLERYGVENPFESKEIQEKIKKTNLKKYGFEHVMSSTVIRKKALNTNKKRYGTEFPNQSDEIKEKKKKTCLKHFGTENPFKSEEIRNKAKETLIKNYGVENPMHSDEIKNRLKDTVFEKYGMEYVFQSQKVKDKVSKTCQERYGVPWACMRKEARLGYSNDSVPNMEFADLLKKNDISYEREFHISKYSYDFKIGNTLIEIDPTATHNTVWNPFGGGGVTEKYHKEKSRIAESAGYHCIHVFDWNDSLKIVKLISRTNIRVYARDCMVRLVDLEDCKKFLNEYHLQGFCKGQEIRLGLYEGDKLISFMSLGSPRYNKNYQYELIRYCSSVHVTGGAEKMFNYFLKQYNPESIISYCDKSKFTGNVYKKLWFRLKHEGGPYCHWYSMKEKRHISEKFLNYKGFDGLFGTSYGKSSISNKDLMIDRGFLPVYDCGQAVYVWKKG